MEKANYRISANASELQAKLDALRVQLENSTPLVPAKAKRLGKILRRRSLFFFKSFLRSVNLLDKIPPEMVPLFMDYLTIKHFDLQDLEPGARSRLREAKLDDQSEDVKTPDYKHYVDGSDDPPSCKHCAWFVTPPAGEEDSCVALGTKGPDFPCYGFILKKVE